VRPNALAARVLPKGWIDLLRQIVLFCGAYWLYRLVRGQVDGRVATAFENARDVISIERSLHLFIEPSVHAWAAGKEWLIDITSWMYLNSHFVITTIALAWIYLRRNDSFYFVRNMFCVAMGIALVGYIAFPTAPPRFMPEWGFTDSVSQFTGVTDSANALYNPFAAIPSMHVAFSLMIGFSMIGMTRRRWVQALWACYPLVVTFVVVATANHWWFDAFLGALTAAVSAWAARALLARARPDVWAWRPLATADGRVAA
jgi:PAP2 superfamily